MIYGMVINLMPKNIMKAWIVAVATYV